MKTSSIFNVYDILSLIGIESQGDKNINVCCPECDHAHKTHRKTLNINVRKGAFRCNRCGVGGYLVDLYSLFSGKICNATSRAESYDEICARLSIPDNYAETKKREAITKVPNVEKIEFSPAEIEERHKTYSIVFENATLSNKHKQNLIDRGLNADFIEKAGYKSFPQVGHSIILQKIFAAGATVKGVPGFYLKESDWAMVKCKTGIMIPVRDANSRIQGIQIRLDFQDPNRGRFKWWSSSNVPSGCQAKCWCHFIGDINCKSLIIIEGPLKADIVNYYTGKSVLAVTGVNCTSQITDFLRQFPNLKSVYLAFDMDFISNKYVKIALAKLINIIHEYDINTTQLLWNSQYKGLDDFYKHISKSVVV